MVEGAVPDRVRGSYLAKFAIVVGSVLLITAVTAAFFYVNISGTLHDDVESDLQEQAETEADLMADWMVDNQQKARMISSYAELREDETGVQKVLNRENLELTTAAHGVHYVDVETGQVERSTRNDFKGETINDPGIRWHTARGNSVTESEFDELDLGIGSVERAFTDTFEHDGQTLVAFLSPVRDDSGMPTGKAVMITIDVQEHAKLFESSGGVAAAEVGDGEGNVSAEDTAGRTQIVDAEHEEVLFAQDGGEVLTSYDAFARMDVSNASADGENLEVESGVFERSDTGEVVGYARIEGTDWILVKHESQSDAYAVVDSVANTLVVLVLLSLAGFVAIGATLGRSTARELDDLADQASALAEGRTDVDLGDNDRIDEVGRVREAFADTRSYLQTVTDQADAIARQEFDDPVLDEEVPGELGASLRTMRENLTEFVEDLEASREETERAQREAQALADELERQAAEFGDAMSAAAEGDLTRRLDEDVDNEAMREIATAFNGMIEDLEATIAGVAELSEAVDRSTREVDDGVEEIEVASREVGASAEEIATTTAEQSDRIADVYDEMNELSATIEEIATTADEVADRSATAVDRCETGSEAAAEAIAEMEDVRDRTEQIDEEVETLVSEVGQIGEVVDLIGEIADQTNLLALNASIEAASAGAEGGGEGFAVVADEVKALAGETDEATDEVAALIEEVQDSAETTAEEIADLRERVDEGVSTVEEALDALDEIVETVEEANGSVQTIDEATDEQAQSTSEVVSMVDEVTDLSEETDAEADQVAAAAEEQTASVEQVAAATNSMTDRARELASLVETFDVRDGDVDDRIDAERSGELAIRDDEDAIEVADEEEEGGEIEAADESGDDAEAAIEPADEDAAIEGTDEDAAIEGTDEPESSGEDGATEASDGDGATDALDETAVTGTAEDDATGGTGDAEDPAAALEAADDEPTDDESADADDSDQEDD